MKKIPLQEKIKLTSGQGNWHLFESDHIEGRRINVADGPHGVRVYGKKVEDGDFLSKRYLHPTTLFPSASAMASTWNKALIEEAGATIGKECRHHQVDVLLGPGINLKRSPLGGRNFEYYSEDPYLTSEIGQSFVKGVQSQNVGACIKHFALNEQETMRRFVDVDIDERTMHEMYLYPFYKIIKSANPWMIMSSYNKVNGDYASESSYLLQDVLRKQWGYDGVVVSDWGAIQDKVKSIKTGMNVDMPGPSAFEGEVLEALNNNTLSEETLDESLKPVFNLHDKVKQIEQLPSVDLDQHHEVAQNVAAESIVLLENDGILPLKTTNQKLGIIGAFAKEPRINGGGSATVKPHRQETPYEEFSKRFDTTHYASGYDENDTNDTLVNEAVNVAKESDVVLFFTGTTDSIETEGKDRDHLNIPAGHETLFNAIKSANDNIIVILSNGSALDLRNIIPDSRAIVESWFLGGAAGKAIVDVVMGEVNPSGRLQETFPIKLEHTPHYGTFAPLISVDYHHDLIMNGYRYYDTHDYAVQYPFGYGLSYAKITYDNVFISTDPSSESSFITIDVTLSNHSDMDAYETVQIYIGSSINHLVKPKKELKAFEKVHIPANQTKNVTMSLPINALESYDVTEKAFVVYNGSYEIHVAKNVNESVESKTIELTHKKSYAPAMSMDYPVRFLELFYPHWYNYIIENYRKLWWHEKEEPIWRILDRYKRHKKISDSEIDALIKDIKKDLNIT